MHFFSQNRRYSAERGFTLVELLISIAIIGIVTSIALVKYATFDSTVLLKAAVYEIALGLREAQVKSVSVAKNGESFDYPYGMTFTPESLNYTAFRYRSSTEYPKYKLDDGSSDSNAEEIRTFVIGRTMVIKAVCVTVSGTETCYTDGSARLDISFRRPEFKALFYATDGSGQITGVESAKIKVSSPKGSKVFGWVKLRLKTVRASLFLFCIKKFISIFFNRNLTK